MIEVWRQLALSGHECFCRQLHFLLWSFTVVLIDGVRFQCALVVVVYDLFRVVHTAVTYLDSVSVEYFSGLVVFRGTFVY